jgi:uncharacterized protein YprB with RNaseH-like and TPR domain
MGKELLRHAGEASRLEAQIKKSVERTVREEINNALRQTHFLCNDQTCIFNGKHFNDPFKCQLKKVLVGFEIKNGHWCGMYEKRMLKQPMVQEEKKESESEGRV